MRNKSKCVEINMAFLFVNGKKCYTNYTGINLLI